MSSSHHEHEHLYKRDERQRNLANEKQVIVKKYQLKSRKQKNHVQSVLSIFPKLKNKGKHQKIYFKVIFWVQTNSNDFSILVMGVGLELFLTQNFRK